MSKVFFHADDFGVTVEQSKAILDCYENGCLNSLSIIMNSSETEQSYELIRDLVDSGKLRAVAHLNFVEGNCMADKRLVPHLVDENGMFICKYAAMLKLNFSRLHSQIKYEFIAEITAQLTAYTKMTGSKVLSIDSHQHYLQIPMIWEAMCQVVKKLGLTVEYVRIPVDPISPVFSTPKLLFKVPVINHVKWMLLRALTPSKKSRQALGAKIPVFFGMPFTCQMTFEPVKMLLPKYQQIADKKGTDIELMFHPGPVRDIDKLLDAKQQDLIEFYGSNFRDLESEALKTL